MLLVEYSWKDIAKFIRRVKNYYIVISSQATGSLPITVRHIESIIRMAEASAKMHLRDHVQESDMNLAIRMALDSFVDTQKYSVMKSMRQVRSHIFSYLHPRSTFYFTTLINLWMHMLLQTFQKYLSYKKDHSELLYYILRQITLDTLAFQKALHGGRIATIEISEKDLLERVIKLIASNLAWELYAL